MTGAHLETHSILADRPSNLARRRWVEMADACARLRCGDLAERPSGLVGASGAAPSILLDALAQVVERRAAAGDGPGVATAMDAIGLVLDRACPVPLIGPGRQHYPIRRIEAIALWHRLRQATPGLAACPECQGGRPCPRDEMVQRIAPAVLDPVWERGRMLKSFSISIWLPHGSKQDKGGWFSHRTEPTAPGKAGRELADAAMGFLLRTYRAHGEETDAPVRVVFHLTRVIEAGCRDPQIAEMWAWEQAKPGRAEDLRAAIDACEQGLLHRPTGTRSAWGSLALSRDHLRVRLAALERGHETRHHPGDRSHRTRPVRFVAT